MLRNKRIERICCVVLAATILLTCGVLLAVRSGLIAADHTIGYENRLFDTSIVHTLDIVMDDWDAFLADCTNEEYAACAVIIDGESYKNVAIRAKGNTSLSSVAAYGNNRYSFKLEFDHYDKNKSYHGLDKLSLNNLIQDTTYMKDYLSYTLMNKMGVASPLCSFVQIQVNGNPWGLYLAVEGVEDAFLARNYGSDTGELYKPDSMSFGGGRGNGRDFDMDAWNKNQSDDTGESSSAPSDSFSASSGQPAQGEDAFSPSFGGQSPQDSESDFAPSSGQSAQDENAFPASFGGPSPQNGENDFAPSSGQPAQDVPPSSSPIEGQTPTGDEAPSSSFPEPPNANAPASEWQAPPDGSSSFDFSSDQMRQGFGGFGGFGGGMGSSDVRLQYIDDNPDSYVNIFSNAKTDPSAADQARLIASLKALSEGDSSVVDTDQVMRYLAVHHFLCNGDSYTGAMVHNYYLHEQDGVLSMIPWDYNLAFGTFSGGMNGATSEVNSPIDSPVSSGSIEDRPMVSWIFASEEYTSAYHAIYQEFIDTVFTSGWFGEELDRVTAMIAPYVEQDPTAFYSYDEFTQGVATLRSFCEKRAASIRGQLDGTIPSTQEGQRESDALIDASELNLSDMGSMNNGKGGGPQMPDGMFGSNKRPSDRNSVRRENASEEQAMPSDSASPDDFLPDNAEILTFPGAHSTPNGESLQQRPNLSWLYCGLCFLVLAAAILIARRWKGRL